MLQHCKTSKDGFRKPSSGSQFCEAATRLQVSHIRVARATFSNPTSTRSRAALTASAASPRVHCGRARGILHNPELTFSSSSKGSSEVEAPHQAVCKVANDSYKGNTGSSNEQCCDQTCAAVTCPKDQKAGCNVYVSVKLLRQAVQVPLELRDSAGRTPKDCKDYFNFGVSLRKAKGHGKGSRPGQPRIHREVSLRIRFPAGTA